MIMNYNGRNIELSYKSISNCVIDVINPIILKTKGSGKGKDYCCVEQEARMYLIKYALEKIRKNNFNLVGIMGITQDVIGEVKDGGVEIILTGKAVFKKN